MVKGLWKNIVGDRGHVLLSEGEKLRVKLLSALLHSYTPTLLHSCTPLITLRVD